MILIVQKSNKRDIFFIALISCILFIPFLGNVHLFDWDEINFAESAREMIVTGDYLTVQINFEAFWEKPPFFIWLQVLSMKIFGINEFAARFPNAVCGIVSLIAIYLVGLKYFDRTFALLWVLIYVGSFLPHFYFKSGIIDPWFNLFIFLGIERFICFTNKNTNENTYKNIILSASFIGLAVLTKGPVALLIFLLCGLVFLIMKKFKLKITFRQIIVYTLVFSFVGGFWFLLQIISGRHDLIFDFVEYQIRLFSTKDAGHGGFLLYHFVILFIGVIPASVVALPAFRIDKKRETTQQHVKFYMTILFWVVLILFTIVKTKIVHYSSLCYFPLTFLAAYFAHRLVKNKEALRTWQKIVLIFFSFLFSLTIFAMTNIDRFKHKLIPLIKDPFAVGNLQADGQWTGFEFLVSLILIGGVIFSLLRFKNNIKKQLIGIFISSLLFINLTMTLIVPHVERYSQNAVIEFYKSKKNENCYVETLGFKSYAQLFYFKKKPEDTQKKWTKDDFLLGKADKPVYFVTKIQKAQRYLKSYPLLKKIGEKNGFVFLQLKNE